MSHVTIEQLREQLAELVRWRAITVLHHRQEIQRAERTIKKINKDFDTRALSLHQQIELLEPSPSEKKPRQHVENFEGLTEQEITHYRELLARKD